MILAVVGSREFPYEFMIYEYLSLIYPLEIVSGAAHGVDTWAGWWAQENNKVLKVFEADWDKYGKSAGFKRNVQIVKYCDQLVAFWDGKSRGTKHSIDLAKNYGKLREVIIVER